MKLVQKGGNILETEEAFFEWLEKDSNIEDLLKSTLQFLDYKTKVASLLVNDTMNELDMYWKTSLLARAKTKRIVDSSFENAVSTIKKEKLEPVSIIVTLESMGISVQSTADAQGKDAEAKYLARLSTQINQTQTLKGLYTSRKNEICTLYFAKKSNPVKYKEALQSKRSSIREKVNEFIESFTGESNRRHRLTILNYAIDFAQNWTSFQGNYKLNLLITGGAGLGKTTFAKAIGKLFYEFGFLARNLFQIREKTDFIAEYLGQTPTKTYSILYGALESMVFIDEAYSVSGCGAGSTYDYGQEFIDALVDITQKTRGLISVVAAGYKAEMHNCFLDKNPGMRRRFPNELELTPYSSIDLDNILTANVLRPIFPQQLNTVLKMDLLKEPEIYFQDPVKFKEFGKEILLRLPEFGRNEELLSFIQSLRTGGVVVIPENELYRGLIDDAKRSESLTKLAQSNIQEYPLIYRYRTKIIGLYRFFMQLASFDTNFNSFESMYNAHQFLWSSVTENNPLYLYKYNNYRIMHLIYLSSNKQRREIMKSYLLRTLYSEKEGSLFPNQAGDMDTLAAFIKSQPNIRMNTKPTFEEVIKVYNEYFRSRGGSQFILQASKTEDKIELLIYHIGGGFINYTDFEEGILAKLFKGFTVDGTTVSSLWNLSAQTPEDRETIIRKINKFYSQACESILRDAEESLKTSNSNEKNGKRLPSGIDIRFLEAEVTSFLGANSGSELGDETKMKYLDFVSSGEIVEESGLKAILNEITKETGSVEAPKSFSLDDAILCKDFVSLGPSAGPIPPMPPIPPAPPLDPAEKEKALKQLQLATVKKDKVPTESLNPISIPPPILVDPAPALPKPVVAAAAVVPKPVAVPVAVPNPLGMPDRLLSKPPSYPLDEKDPKNPLKILRIAIEQGKKGPSNFSKMEPLISMKRITGALQTTFDEYKLTVNPLPHAIPNDGRSIPDGYHYFLIEWTQGNVLYKGQGFVYVLRGSKQCSQAVPLYKNKDLIRFYEFEYLGRLDELYAPKPVPRYFSLDSTGTFTEKEVQDKLNAIYPARRLDIDYYKKTLNGSASDAILLNAYRKKKLLEYAAIHGIDLKNIESLWYHGPPVNELKDLGNTKSVKQLSIARIFPGLSVASIKNYVSNDTNEDPLIIFSIESNYPELMNTENVYYSVNSDPSIPKEYPIEFLLTDAVEEENEDNYSDDEEEEPRMSYQEVEDILNKIYEPSISDVEYYMKKLNGSAKDSIYLDEYKMKKIRFLVSKSKISLWYHGPPIEKYEDLKNDSGGPKLLSISRGYPALTVASIKKFIKYNKDDEPTFMVFTITSLYPDIIDTDKVFYFYTVQEDFNAKPTYPIRFTLADPSYKK